MEKKGFSKKKLIINLALTLAVCGLAFYYLTKSDIINAESLSKVSVGSFFVVFSYFILAILLLSFCDYLIYRTCSPKMNYPRCVINTLMGNLGSGITPFRSGHFPLMAYYQLESGVTVEQSATGIVKCQVIYSITSILVYGVMTIVFAVLQSSILFYDNVVYIWLVILVGFSFHVIVFFMIVLLSFCPPIQRLAVKWYSAIYCKIKKNANREEVTSNLVEKLQRYKTQILAVFKSPKASIPAILVYMVFMPILGTAQYIAYLIISGAPFSVENFLIFYTLNITITYIANVVPLPGGVGTSEVLFSVVFASVIAESLLGATLVLWRISTFYAVIVIEVLLFLVWAVMASRSKIKRKYGVEEKDQEIKKEN